MASLFTRIFAFLRNSILGHPPTPSAKEHWQQLTAGITEWTAADSLYENALSEIADQESALHTNAVSLATALDISKAQPSVFQASMRSDNWHGASKQRGTVQPPSPTSSPLLPKDSFVPLKPLLRPPATNADHVVERLTTQPRGNACDQLAVQTTFIANVAQLTPFIKTQHPAVQNAKNQSQARHRHRLTKKIEASEIASSKTERNPVPSPLKEHRDEPRGVSSFEDEDRVSIVNPGWTQLPTLILTSRQATGLPPAYADFPLHKCGGSVWNE